MIKILEKVISGKAGYDSTPDGRISEFFEKHRLIDLRKLKRIGMPHK